MIEWLTLTACIPNVTLILGTIAVACLFFVLGALVEQKGIERLKSNYCDFGGPCPRRE